MKATTTLLLTVLLMTCPQLRGQINAIGMQVSALYGYPSISNKGLLLNADYSLDRRSGILVAAGYYFPYSRTSSRTLYSKNGQSVTPSSVTVGTSDKSTGWQITLTGKYYFLKAYDRTGFSIYGLAGFGLLSFNIKEDIGVYDEQKYGRYSRQAYENQNSTNFIYNLGLGFGYQGKKGTLFFESVLNVPIDHDATLVFEMPNTFQYSVGYRYFVSK